MKSPHRFLSETLSWLGEGSIKLTATKDEMRFLTKWDIELKKEGRIAGRQEVEIPGVSHTMVNRYEFMMGATGLMEVTLENEAVGKVKGKGSCDEKSVVWEFRCPEQAFEGFEVFERLEADRYRFHGEYYGGENVRTIIEGQIWEKIEEQD